MKKSKLTLSIDGRDYIVISDQSEEHLVRLGLLVDRHIRDVREGFPTISTTDAAVLAALNIGDEYLRLQEKQPTIVSVENMMGSPNVSDELQTDETFSKPTKW